MIGSPNPIAYLVLFLWIPFSVWLFKRYNGPKATVLCVLGSTMFLPELVNVDPPLLPPFNKTSIAALVCWVLCMRKARGRIRRAKAFQGIDVLFIFVLVGNVGTSLSNGDVLITGAVVRPPLSLYDSLALGIKDTLSVYLPFFLARAMLQDRRDLHEFARLIVVGGLIYSVLASIEMRVSPQLNNWIYGFHQADFTMSMRFGGYRPTIFMAHGLAVALFMLGASVLAITRHRLKLGKGKTALWLTILVVACKSTGAVVYGILVWPLVYFGKKPGVKVAAFFALTALLYPALRTLDLFPDEKLVEYAGYINEKRALSLWFRFDQESLLLERGRERSLFGWGGYDRNRLFDPISGEDLSVTDGDWAIQVGTRGLVGFIGLYGMLAFPVVLLLFRLKRIRSVEDRRLLAALAMFSALFTVDLLPNGLFNCLPFFFAGAVHGLTLGLLKEQRKRAAKERAARRERGKARLSSAPPPPHPATPSA